MKDREHHMTTIITDWMDGTCTMEEAWSLWCPEHWKYWGENFDSPCSVCGNICNPTDPRLGPKIGIDSSGVDTPNGL